VAVSVHVLQRRHVYLGEVRRTIEPGAVSVLRGGVLLPERHGDDAFHDSRRTTRDEHSVRQLSDRLHVAHPTNCVLLALRRDGVAKPRYRTIGRRRGLPGGSHVRQRVRVHAHATASANQIPRQRRKHRPDGTDGGWRDDRAATADDASRCAIRSASCRATAASDVRVHGASDASVPATAPRRELLPDGLGTKFTRRYQQ